MSLAPEEEYLFVYGSLQSGANHPAHKVLTEYAYLICNAEFEGHLFLVADYPGVVAGNHSPNNIKGELYHLKRPTKVFQKLDPYEGYNPHEPENSLYIRQKCDVHCPNRTPETISAWIYLYNRPTENLTRIPSGDYLSYVQKG
ncbi:gamma-glutamylcyclotransferase [Aliifodinibius sp. S!AR15-10]|uniref:gamma-glutamylcyclotransferase family protein n=1 Tax=Aliifodinibius sp. S!AR15-10 TaxID=2950437 RepID=UPI00285EE2A6|nr:gamma-glutamylcyclotransferase family protein [Aliifodinibius sp. S!AR15-10]MDR8392071.1 gamma-glutamylcyclotransferase [Aliifodinibius sp. S!AR15-10]